MRILLAEDDPVIADGICRALRRGGCAVDHVADGMEADAALAGQGYDLLILDLGLPRMNGIEVLKRLRARKSAQPVLILTAQDGVDDRVRGLDAGADDYLTKPFGSAELLARIRAHLRRRQRAGADGPSLLAFGAIRLDLGRRLVEKDGQPLHLTPIEFRLLAYLAANPDCVLTHRQLLKAVWGPSHAEDSHYVRVYMGHLRKKLEADPANPDHIVTEPGIGYRFVVEP